MSDSALREAAEALLAFLDTVEWNTDSDEREASDVMEALRAALAAEPGPVPLSVAPAASDSTSETAEPPDCPRPSCDQHGGILERQHACVGCLMNEAAKLEREAGVAEPLAWRCDCVNCHYVGAWHDHKSAPWLDFIPTRHDEACVEHCSPYPLYAGPSPAEARDVAGWLRGRARVRRMQSAGGPRAFENRMFKEAKVAEKLANEWNLDHVRATAETWCGTCQRPRPCDLHDTERGGGAGDGSGRAGREERHG